MTFTASVNEVDSSKFNKTGPNTDTVHVQHDAEEATKADVDLSTNCVSATCDCIKQTSSYQTLDDIYRSIGSFGPFQRRVVLLLALISFSTAFNNLGYVFWAARPSFHHCAPSNNDCNRLQLQNMTSASSNDSDCSSDELLNMTIPWESVNDQCVRSRCSAFDISNVANVSWLMNDDVRNTLNVTTCKRWLYDTSQYKSTIVTLHTRSRTFQKFILYPEFTSSWFVLSWNLVCSQNWLVAFTQSAYMAGRIIGTQIYGHVLDRFGRRNTLLISVSLEVAFAVSCALVDNIYAFLVLRFLLGIQTTGELQAACVTVTEMVGSSYRVMAATAIQLVWAVAYMMLAGIAYLIRDRITLHITLSAPLVVLPIIFFWFIPETPRWLLVKGRSTEAIAVLEKIAKSNGTSLSKSDVLRLRVEEDKQAKSKLCSSSILDLFRTARIRQLTVFLLYSWFVNSLVFYGLSLSATRIGGNDYINFFISGAVEVPANLACLVTLERFGRTKPLALSMSLAGLVLLTVVLVPNDLLPVRVAMTMLGKASITYSYALIYIYTPEVYPTVIRGTGLGAAAMLSRVGGVLAPIIADLGSFMKDLPSILFGTLAMIAGLLALGLPETGNTVLLQTVDEAELMMRDSLLSRCWKASRKSQTYVMECKDYNKQNTGVSEHCDERYSRRSEVHN